MNPFILFLNNSFQLFKYYTFLLYICCVDLVEVLDLYNGFVDYTRDDDIQTKPIIIPKYEDKYINEYHLLETETLQEDKKESLSHNFIMEKTPIGNVIMNYDFKKSSFLYYSDSTVPFRYLETIGRKYVITFKCKELFIDMNTEIENAKTIKPEKTGKPIKTKDMIRQIQNPQNPVKTSIPIKVNTNRYTSMGRISNFKICKHVDRTKIDKHYSISFSDFKKMNSNKTSV